MSFVVPETVCAAPSSDDQALREKRRKIKEALLNNQQVRVTPDTGSLTTEPTGPGIVVPEGKLASFYWYENDTDLYAAEREAMRRFFPSFRLEKEGDGRLAWYGQVSPGLIESRPRVYTLQAVYDHAHPSNSNYGGSVRVYCIDPDLEAVAQGTQIPHTLRDSQGELYICTARREDVKTGRTVTTAAVALSWAVKWLSVFELWLNDEVSDAEFRGHAF